MITITQNIFCSAVCIVWSFLVCVWGMAFIHNDKEKKHIYKEWFQYLILFLYFVVPALMLWGLHMRGIDISSNAPFIRIIFEGV